jgi:hypothetical protein
MHACISRPGCVQRHACVSDRYGFADETPQGGLAEALA